MRTRFCFYILLCALFLASCGSTARSDAPSADATEVMDDADTAANDETVSEEDVAPTVEEQMPTAEPTNAPTAAAVATDGPVKDVYAVGDTARLGVFRITLHEVKTATETELGKPDAGNEFRLLGVTLENTASQEQQVALLTQTLLEDPTAKKEYMIDPGASLEAVLSLNGTLDPQEQAKGTIGFQVPTGAQGLRFVFRTTDGMNELDRAVFTLE